MRTFSKTLLSAGLIVAFAAVPLAQAAAQDAMTSQSTTTQTTSENQTVPGKVDDAWITTKVKSEFATTKAVHATDISVDTMEGKVMLSGSVATKHEKMKAVKLAKHVKGVNSVDASGLTVSGVKTTTTSTTTTTDQPAVSSTVGQ